MTLTLKRIITGEDGTFGVLLLDNKPFAVTLEREWLNNMHSISCIPAGAYTCKYSFYHKGGYPCYEVMDVPDRSNILIHKGNIEDDSAGCILIGEQFEALKGKTAILQSGKGFQEFMDRLKRPDGQRVESFTLNIIWAEKGPKL